MKPSRASLILASLILSACGSGVSGSVPLSSAGSRSATPSADESTREPGATAHSAGALGRDGIAEVVTEDLVVRSLPEISPGSIIAPVAQSTGKLLFVLDGPVAADGYEWYHVAPFDEFVSDIASEAPRLGWVAAGRSGEVWIAPWTGECPERTLEAIRFRSPFLTLACFGDDELALQGILGDCDYVVPGIVEPGWLAFHHCWLLPFDLAGLEIVGGLVVRQEGEVLDSLGKGAAVRVVGHFDHPAAQTCVEHTLQGEDATPPELVVLYCRTQFVATDVTAITASAS